MIKHRLTFRAVTKIILILIALILFLLPLPAGFVERAYTNGFYSFLQSALTPVANLVPFAIVDVLLVAAFTGLPVWWIVRIKRAGRGRRWRAAGRLAFNTLALAAAIFITFELLWGFNYERAPLRAKLDFDNARVSAQAAADLRRGGTDDPRDGAPVVRHFRFGHAETSWAAKPADGPDGPDTPPDDRWCCRCCGSACNCTDPTPSC